MGKIIIKLYPDCPKTSENFRCLCTGEKGEGQNGFPLNYCGSSIFKIEEDYLIQGGDITKDDGTGGESIYGQFFKDESFEYKHDKPYLVGMANLGRKNTNSS